MKLRGCLLPLPYSAGPCHPPGLLGKGPYLSQWGTQPFQHQVLLLSRQVRDLQTQRESTARSASGPREGGQGRQQLQPHIWGHAGDTQASPRLEMPPQTSPSRAGCSTGHILASTSQELLAAGPMARDAQRGGGGARGHHAIPIPLPCLRPHPAWVALPRVRVPLAKPRRCEQLRPWSKGYEHSP